MKKIGIYGVQESTANNKVEDLYLIVDEQSICFVVKNHINSAYIAFEYFENTTDQNGWNQLLGYLQNNSKLIQSYYRQVQFVMNTKNTLLTKLMNAGANAFGDLLSKQWFDNAAISVSLQIPIFDGNSKKYKAVQSANNLQKVRQSFDLLKSSIDFQRSQSTITLKNSLESLKQQKANLMLANEISRVTRVKYQQGVGSNLEVLNAESSIKESQANYFTSL